MDHRELNHVAIHVEDVEQSCAFYERVLELKPIPRPATISVTIRHASCACE